MIRASIRAAAFGMALASAAPAGKATEAELQLGHALFTGATALLEAPVEAISGRYRACHGCHGRDGAGGIEGEVPPIGWEDLSRPTALRPAYSAADFHRAMTEGIDPTGRTLSRIMPRYDLTAKDTAALAAYLAILPRFQRRGVGVDTLTFCLPARTHRASASYAEEFVQEVKQLTGATGIYGRGIRVEVLDPDRERALAEAEAACLAVVGIAGTELGLEALADRGVPTLFPFARLAGDEDPSLVRDLKPSRRDISEAIAGELGKMGARHVHIVPANAPGAEDLARSLRLSDRPGGMAVTTGSMDEAADATDIVLLDPVAPDALTAAAAERRLWVKAEVLGQVRLGASELSAIVIIEDPHLLGLAEASGGTLLEVHARCAAALIVEALKIAGRDVTRARLLQAFNGISMPFYDLNYPVSPLTGTKTVIFVDTTSSNEVP